MIIHRQTACLLALLLCAAAAVCRAGDAIKPTKEELRVAIIRSLGFLEKEGDAWVAKETCLGCHHQPMLLWGHNEARRRGFAVDQKKLDEWLKWLALYADAKGGPEALSLMLMTAPSAGQLPDALKPATLTKDILAIQLPNGAWRATGRLANNQRRKPAEGHEFATLLTLQALALTDVQDEEIGAASERAQAWLKKTESPQSIEPLMLRALLAGRSGKADEAKLMIAALLKQQHADGGWAWRVGEPESDAYATGETLYVLNEVDAGGAAQSVVRAQHWLLSHQREDGAWPVNSSLISAQGVEHHKATDAIYTTWATAWVELALLQEFPVVVPSVAGPK